MEVPSPLQPTNRVGKKENRIVKHQVKLLTGKTTLAGWPKVLPQDFIHLSDQPESPIALYATLGTPAEVPSAIKV